MNPFEVIAVSALEVACDGSGHTNAPGHPRVFLHIDQTKGSVTCPYCSRQYVLRILAGKQASGH